MLLKYNLSSEITDNVSTDIKWLLPKTFTIATDHLYQFNSVTIDKGNPFTLTVNIDPLYTLRYIVINSDNSFTINVNNSFELLTTLYALDVGPSRVGFTGLTDVNHIILTNPTGATGPLGSQFSNPATIEVRYMLILEKI